MAMMTVLKILNIFVFYEINMTRLLKKVNRGTELIYKKKR